jgi:hypothetical protein
MMRCSVSDTGRDGMQERCRVRCVCYSLRDSKYGLIILPVYNRGVVVVKNQRGRGEVYFKGVVSGIR